MGNVHNTHPIKRAGFFNLNEYTAEMTRTEIAKALRTKMNQNWDKREDILINEIAQLRYEINGLRNLNLAPGDFRLSVTQSNPHRFISPEDIK